MGLLSETEKESLLPDVKSHGQHPGDPQRMVTFIPPTHPDLMVSTGPSVKLAWRRCRLRQSGKACHMVSHAGQTASWVPGGRAHSQGKLMYKANLTLSVLKWFQGKPELSSEFSASSLMGPRSSPHPPSSSLFPTHCHPESPAPHMSPHLPPMCFSCVLSPSKAWHSPLVGTSALPCSHLFSGPLLDIEVTDKETRGPGEDKWWAHVWAAGL